MKGKNGTRPLARRMLLSLMVVVMTTLLPADALAVSNATPAPVAGTAAEVVSFARPESVPEAPGDAGFIFKAQTGDASVFEPGSAKSEFFLDYRFPGVQSLYGIMSSTGTYVTLPDYAVAENATMRLTYTCSDLVIERLSSITLYMNGTPFFSCPVTYSAEGPTVVYADLPMHLLQDNFNLLEIGSYVRLTEEEGCIDDYMGANWINIGEDTCLRVGCRLVPDADLLKYYPFPFIHTQDDDGSALTVAVSDAMDNKELEAGLLTMADLGDYAVVRNAITFSAVGYAKSKNVILFSLKQNITPEHERMLGDAVIPQGGALIKRISSPEGNVLLVVSESGDALVEAARLLADDNRIKQIGSTQHIVMMGEAAILMSNSVLSDMVIKGEYTLKDIHGGGIRLTGPFHQVTTIYLPVPNDYTLSSESKFSIRFRYSENLDFNRSLITVYWGDVPVASKKLTLEGASGNSLTLVTPVDLVGTIGSNIRIAFDLEVQDLICTPRQSQMPWAYVSDDSTFYLPFGKAGTLSLGNRPAPFQRDGVFNSVMAVFSDQPDASELLLMGRAASALGVGSRPYGSLKVIRASEFSEADADYNIITAGTGSGNAFIRRINGALYFPYAEDFARFASNAYLTMAENYARTAGSVQLIHSPFAPDRAILALTAPEGIGVSSLTELLSNDRLRWSLTDDVVMVSDRLRTSSFQCYTVPAVEEVKPTFLEAVSLGGQSVVFTLIALGVMLLLLLSVALVLIRLRMRSK